MIDVMGLKASAYVRGSFVECDELGDNFSHPFRDMVCHSQPSSRIQS